jgi:ATP-dependent protease HslVU (ClpYQ) peptidase subunit
LISHNGEWAIFASAGDMQDAVLAKAWLESDQQGPKPKLNSDSFVAIMVTKKKAYRMEEALAMWEITAPHTLGSGRDFARACLHLGMDAVKAVKVASELDVFTGGEVDVIEVASLI